MSFSLADIVQGCKQRKSSAQQALYRHFSAKMMAVCYRYAKDREEAEDMLQEGFIKIFQKINEYKHEGSLEGWIRRIVVNTAIDHLRKQKHWQNQVELEEVKGQDAGYEISDGLEMEYLMKIIQQLPSGYRAIFNLYAIEGFSHKEIAQQLRITESTSRSQYTRARSVLIDRIREDSLETNTFSNAI